MFNINVYIEFYLLCLINILSMITLCHICRSITKKGEGK